MKTICEGIAQMMEAWKDVPDVADEISQPNQSKSSSKGNFD